MAEKINIAKGHAEAIERTAQARAVGLQRVADALQVRISRERSLRYVCVGFEVVFGNIKAVE